MTRSKFDWSILDRNSLYCYLWGVSDKIVGHPLFVPDIHKILANQLKTYLPIRVIKRFNEKVEFGYIYIGGAYYSDYDQDHEKCIEINFSYNPFEEKITLSKLRFKRMCMLFADTLLHEIIHMRQYRRRDYRVLPDYPSTAEKEEQRLEQRYLGCTDEIDAYGFNIACELTEKFSGDHKKIVKYLNENQKNKSGRNNCWKDYVRAFDYNHNHPVIQKLKKKIIQYLPNAEIGKPYRNKDWINY